MQYSTPARIDRAHPILTGEYAVYTPPVDEMIAKIGDWIDQRQSGGYIYGASRFGKSRGVKWHVRSVLQERFGSVIPLVIWKRRSDMHTSESAFWHELLLTSHFHFEKTDKIPRKNHGFYLIAQRLMAIAQAAGHNYVVLLIDEAQEVSFREWKWLVGLQNQLDWDGFRLSVFSVGTHQMGYQHELMAISGNAHVAARFMAAHSRFHGLRSEAEVAYVLDGYDIGSEWPAGSGVSFLQYFAPTDYAAGRRLAECAGIFWKSMVELTPSQGKRAPEFPMQHLAHSVERILDRLAKDEAWDEVMEYKSLLSIFADTGFSSHMRIVNTAG
jgi:hypothetical protein